MKVQQKREIIQGASYERSQLKLLHRVQQRKQSLQQLSETIQELVLPKVDKLDRTLLSLDFQLKSLNPLMPLEKGFTRIIQGDKMIKKASDFDTKSPFVVEWKDGSVRLSKT